jgi:serine/threonine protein kinase
MRYPAGVRISRPPEPPSAPPPHTRFAGFSLIERIAVGGMAEVFRAEDGRGTEKKTVVVKRMLASLAREPATRAMFDEEARIGLSVDDENVVRVLASGEADGLPYLVLEHVGGVDLWRLQRWLTRVGKTMSTELAVHIARRMLLGLHAVHEARGLDGRPLGVVHRDVSPSNLLLSVLGEVKLGDFGIAQALLRQSFPQATVTGRTKGKLGYLAPEQVRGQTSDRRADVFAAGVVTAELLMGRPLFTGGSELAILLAIRDAQIRPFEEAAASLAPALAQAVKRALTRTPGERTASALELARALEPFETQSERELRRELASFVSAAAQDRIPSGQIAAVTEQPPATPAPQTSETPALEYRVRTASGQVLGPLSYAKLIEAVATRHIGPDDTVGLIGSPLVPVAKHPELARHIPASSLSERTVDHPAAASPDREIDLAQGTGVLPILAQLTLERETGLLLCVEAGVRKEVYLESGVPEFVSSNVAGELLGEFLVSREVISRGELDMALAVMPRFDGRLGDTLAALGLVEPVALFRQIASQVEEKLLDLFLWQAGRATFYRGVARPPSGFPLGLDPWRILTDGVARRIAAGLEPEMLALRMEAPVETVRPAPRGLAGAPLPPGLRRALDRGLRSTPLAQIFDDAGRDVERAVRDATLLFGLGAIRWSTAP